MVQDFDALLADVIHGCLTELLGRNAAQIFCAHIDPKLASGDPEGFVSRIRSVIGPAASEAIVRRIENSLKQRLGNNITGNSIGFPNFIRVSETVFSTQRQRT